MVLLSWVRMSSTSCGDEGLGSEGVTVVEEEVAETLLRMMLLCMVVVVVVVVLLRWSFVPVLVLASASIFVVVVVKAEEVAVVVVVVPVSISVVISRSTSVCDSDPKSVSNSAPQTPLDATFSAHISLLVLFAVAVICDLPSSLLEFQNFCKPRTATSIPN